MKTTETNTESAKNCTSREQLPNIVFSMMRFIMKLNDIFRNQSEKNFRTLGLQQDQIVVDYGCGPARYVKKASETVGPKGKVYAVDIHPLAIKNVNQIKEKYSLQNVEAVLASGYSCNLPNRIADVVYALDMFHMIEHPTKLIEELARIVTYQGEIIIEDGHQPRSKTLKKINDSGLLCIYKQNKHHLVCKLKETKCLPPA